MTYFYINNKFYGIKKSYTYVKIMIVQQMFISSMTYIM